MIKKILKIIFTMFFGVIVFTTIIIAEDDWNEKIPVVLKAESFTFEHGSNISTQMDNYFVVLNEKEINECSLELPNDFKIGDNEAKLYWKDEMIVFKIIIEDNQSPEIILNKEKIEIDFGEVYDLKSNIKSVKDVVDGDLEYTIEGKINSEKPGEYKIKVIAEDFNKNVTTKDFVVLVKEKTKQDEKQPVSNNASNNSNTTSISSLKKQHYINSNKIIKTQFDYNEYYDWNSYVKIYRDMIMNSNDGKLHYIDTASFALVDFDLVAEGYLEYESSDIFIYENGNVVVYKDKEGEYIQIRPDRLDIVKNAIKKREEEYSKHRIIYKNTIVNALKGMNLYCSDKEMVEQINQWIIKNITYKVTNNRDYFELFSVNGYKGQCYHYALLFRDMVKAVGINVTYEEGISKGDSHAWNTVTIDGKKYCFDVTWNDSYGDNRWSWVNPKEFAKTHKK